MTSRPDLYATLGLARDCTTAEVRAAYRALAKQHHPDVNATTPGAAARMEALNAAHETLSDPTRRREYDRQVSGRDAPQTRGRIERNISQEVLLGIEEFLRGTELEVRVKDPAQTESELYRLTIPPETAPGARFRIARAAGGAVQVRVRARPHFRFKVRGSDLRCDLRISAERAVAGGTETVAGATGGMVRVKIPARAARGEILRVPGEGLPNARGGRGDLLVRVTYRPEVRITRGQRG
ncbi:MAG: DnaJ C-terminal domain-containing protein [Chthoniobacterales bacterium]